MISINSKEYIIGEELGKGGNGQVFLALDEKENKYAIKKISIKGLNEDQINSIENEAKILSNIGDTNNHIVKFYGSCINNDDFYILMEFCEGLDLNKFIKEKNTLIDETLVYNIVLEICLGIKELHKRNIIHRDLKPENIFIDKNHHIKIGDFGISRQLTSTKYTYSVIGTNFYMAPEIINAVQYNTKVDIWSFGCIIYELLTLKVCFEGKGLSFVNKITSGKHGKIDTNKYKPKWQELIDSLLKLNYKERPDIESIYNFILKELNPKIKIIENLTNEEFHKINNEGNNISYITSKKKYIILNLIYSISNGLF